MWQLMGWVEKKLLIWIDILSPVWAKKLKLILPHKSPHSALFLWQRFTNRWRVIFIISKINKKITWYIKKCGRFVSMTTNSSHPCLYTLLSCYFEITLCSTSYQELESVFQLLKFSLAMWLALANRTLANKTQTQARFEKCSSLGLTPYCSWNSETTIWTHPRKIPGRGESYMVENRDPSDCQPLM